MLHEAKVAAEIDTIVATLRHFSGEIRQVGIRGRHADAVPYLWFEPSRLRCDLPGGAAGSRVIGGDAQQDRPQRCARAGADPAHRLVPHGARQGYREPSGAGPAVEPQDDPTKCIDLENEVRGLLKVFGVRLPARVGHGGFDELVRPKVLALLQVAKCLLPLLDARSMLYRTYLQLDNAVRGMARQDRLCQRLMTVPGVRSVTSLTFKTAVDEPRRFRSSRTVAAHFGLTRGNQSPDVRKQPLPSNRHPMKAWQTGGVHVQTLATCPFPARRAPLRLHAVR